MHTSQQAVIREPSAGPRDESIADREAAAGLYRLLGRCLEEEVDRPLLQLLRGALREPLAAAGWHLDADFLERPVDELLEALAEEYTGLFVAPGGACPYASVFETGALFGTPCDRVMAAYREAGFDYQRRRSGEFPDHIGTMLGLLGHLAAAESQAALQGDAALAQQARQRHDTFLRVQVGRWGPGWCRRAAGAALTPFYRQLLQFTEQFLWQCLAEVTDRRGLKELTALNQREPPRLDYNADFRKASGL